jgi:hypothetical protein
METFKIALGRVCCQKKCDCEFVFKDAETGRDVRQNLNIPIPPIFLQQTQNLGYECSDELSDCMSFCRKTGFTIVSAVEPDLDQDESTSETDTFKVNEYKKYMCNLINQSRVSDTQGYNVYIRYLNRDNALFPYKDDLHVGRLCCKKTFGQFIGLNRCNQTDLNTPY